MNVYFIQLIQNKYMSRNPRKSVLTLVLTAVALYVSSSWLFFWPLSAEEKPKTARTSQSYEATTVLSGNLEDFRDPLLLADKRSTYKYDYTHAGLGDLRLSGDDQENWKAEYSANGQSGRLLRPEISGSVDSDGHYGARVGSSASKIRGGPGPQWQVQYDSRTGGVRGDVATQAELGEFKATYAAKASLDKKADISFDQDALVEYMVGDDASLFARSRGGYDKVNDWQVGAKMGDVDHNILHSPTQKNSYGASVAYGSDGAVITRGQVSADLGNSVQAQYEVSGRAKDAKNLPELNQALNVRYEKEPGSVVFGRLEKKPDRPASLRVGYTVKN
jgi:hypothetical protein